MQSFDDIFSIEHPVFCWIYRASRYWQSVADLIPSMRTHIRTGSFTKYNRSNSTAMARESPDGTGDYSQVFKELFCVAAQDLASMIQEPLEKLGVLYDEIINTGTVKKNAQGSMFSRNWPAAEDLERANRVMTLGRGQLLFVIRKVDRLESAQLQASGFRFAPVHQVLEHLARSMQVTVEELRPQLEKMKEFPFRSKMLGPGVYLSCFALRPLYQRGFDILVNKDAKNLLPTVGLNCLSLEPWQINIIKRLDNWTVSRCLQWLSTEIQTMLVSLSEREKDFFGLLFNATYILSQQVNEDFFQSARLTSQVMRAPCFNEETGMTGQAEVIAFRIIIDVHQSSLLNERMTFTPTRFFLCQQHVYPKSPDHGIFARRVHQEFASVLERSDRNAERASTNSKSKGVRELFRRTPVSPRLSTLGSNPGRRGSSPSTSRGDASSEKDLIEETGSTPFGGIHVSNEVTIDVSQAQDGERSPDVEMTPLGVYAEAGVATVEKESYIDELLAITISERRQQRG